MKKLLLLLSLQLASVMVFAAPRNLSQMKAAAKSVLKSPSATTRNSEAQLDVMQQGRQYTVIGYSSGGFAVIANDDAFEAVIGYSDTKFLTDNIPPAMQWWINATDAALQQRLSNGQTMSTNVLPADCGYPASVPQLMLSEWDQSTPYNNEVVKRLGGSYPTGCVATALAQIMYYHKYPTKGTGRKTFSLEPYTGNGTLFVNFGSTTYDWDNMLPIYADNNYTQEQADAVAKLMLHCGVAVDMNYGVGGSGAYDNDVATAAKQYFRYSTKFYTRDIYPTTQWMNIIFDEISNGRPVLYGGATAQMAGHAFVFDGYDESGRVHVNWGWSGSGNGYFNVAVLDSSDESLTEPTQNGYSYQQDMVLMHPEGQPEIPYTSQWGLLDWPLQNTKGSFTVTVSDKELTYTATNLYQLDADPFTGQIGLLAAPLSGDTPTVLDANEVITQSGGGAEYLSGYNEISNITDISSLSDGTYRVYMASKATTETAWQPVHSNETIVNNYILTINGDNVTVEDGEPDWTTGIENVIPGTAVNDGTVRVYTVDGVLVYSAPADGFNLGDVPASGLLIIKNGATVTKVMK